MKEVIERCNWLVNKCKDKSLTPDVKDDVRYLLDEIERLNKCIDEALEIIIKDWNDKCTIPIHAVVDTGDDIRIKLYYQLFFKGCDKE